MRWRHVAVQWATVVVLLLIVVAVNQFYPELMTVETRQGDGDYRAIDGDSFEIGKTEIRLYGIDAPEFRQTCRDGNGRNQPCGKMARETLSKLIRGRTMTCQTIDRDRYGRQVSVCKANGVEINREMVRLGWAIAYRKHALHYVSAENEARRSKRGIWAWEFQAPQDYRQRLRAVEGNASSIKDE